MRTITLTREFAIQAAYYSLMTTQPTPEHQKATALQAQVWVDIAAELRAGGDVSFQGEIPL